MANSAQVAFLYFVWPHVADFPDEMNSAQVAFLDLVRPHVVTDFLMK